MSFAKDTLVRLYNGNEKMIQYINPGDELMYGYSNMLSVKDVIPSRGTLYEIIGEDGSTQIVSESHKLCLYDEELDKIVYHTVLQYYLMSEETRDKLYSFKTGFDYPYFKTEYSPFEYGKSLEKNRSDDLPIYMYNSPDVQWEFLAGVIDAGASTDDGVYVDHHVKEIEFVSRCLGLDVYVKNHRLFFTNKQISDLWNDTILDPFNQKIGIRLVGEGDYYTIKCQSPSMFLLPDFTVSLTG